MEKFSDFARHTYRDPDTEIAFGDASVGLNQISDRFERFFAENIGNSGTKYGAHGKSDDWHQDGESGCAIGSKKMSGKNPEKHSEGGR